MLDDNQGMPLSFKRRHAFAVIHLRNNPTPAECQFRCRLDSLGLDYHFQRSFYHPFVRIADFFIPSLNLIVEIDGPCHDQAEDRRKDEWFTRERGINVLRLTNEQVVKGSFEITVPDFVR